MNKCPQSKRYLNRGIEYFFDWERRKNVQEIYTLYNPDQYSGADQSIYSECWSEIVAKILEEIQIKIN